MTGASERRRSLMCVFVLCLAEQRQFSRLIEMLQLLSVDETDARAMKAYRLQVKERLYRFNFVRTLSILVVILRGRS